MSSTERSAASIDIASCAAFETIVATTGSSVYELIVLRGERGKVLVRGGQHFSTFCPVVFVGSMRHGSAIQRHTIEIGLRMEFYFDNRIILTSAVQSLSTVAATRPAIRGEHATNVRDPQHIASNE